MVMIAGGEVEEVGRWKGRQRYRWIGRKRERGVDRWKVESIQGVDGGEGREGGGVEEGILGGRRKNGWWFDDRENDGVEDMWMMVG